MSDQPTRLGRIIGYVALVLLASSLSSCNRATWDRKAAHLAAPALTASQILAKMVAAYQVAESYRDQALLRVSYRLDGNVVNETEPLAVKYMRPNRLRAVAYNIQLASDGTTLRYKVVDERSGDMDEQFVVRRAGPDIRLKELFDQDPILAKFLSGGAGPPVQLELLLGEKPLEAFFARDVTTKLLTDQTLDGFACYRVEVTTEAGSFLLWIDRQQFLLRQFEYPSKSYLAPLADVAGIGDLKLVAEFHGAQFAEDSAEDFQLTLPQQAKQVRYFVTLPPPLPTDLFGKRPVAFHFTDLQGGKVDQEDLAGQLAVLIWFNNQPASQVNLQKLHDVRAEFLDDDRVKFCAVCTEPSTHASNQRLEQLLSDWKVDMPLVRDLEPFGPQAFGITELPTLVILDQQGRVQYFEVLAEPHLEEILTVALRRLLDGDDLSAEILREYRQELASYQRELSIAGADDMTSQIVTPDSEVLPASKPTHHRLTELWRCSELTAPGNIISVELENSEPGLLVHDGFRSIVRLDHQGRVLERHSLDLPERMGVTYLRTAVGANGERWYAACEILGQQVHVFDGQWKRILSYPPLDQSHGGIRDVQFCDLHNDGTPELYIGFWKLLGVHQVSLVGECLNRNRILPKVYSLAVSEENPLGWRKLLVTDDRGEIVRMNHVLIHDEPLAVDRQAIHHLYSASFSGSDFAVLCGLGYVDAQTMLAVGLDPQIQVVWTYPLPAGVFPHQVQFVVSGQLTDAFAGHWVFARPDGSIHIISDDGQFQDKFACGKSPRGIAVARFGSNRVLLISAGREVTAWQVAPID